MLNSDPRGLSALAPGLNTCIKTGKNMYKIRLQRYFFETCNKWAKWQVFPVDIRILSTKGCLPLPRGYIHVEKIRIQRDFFKLTTNGRSGKSFLLTSKFWPQAFVCPCPGAICMYKIIKNVYKIRIQRDHFETCNKWSKWSGLSVDVKTLSPRGCLRLAWGYIYAWKHNRQKYV